NALAGRVMKRWPGIRRGLPVETTDLHLRVRYLWSSPDAGPIDSIVPCPKRARIESGRVYRRSPAPVMSEYFPLADGDAEAAEADFAPFVLALHRLVMRFGVIRRPLAGLMGDADRALAQIDDDAAMLLRHDAHRLVEPGILAEHVRHHIFRVQAHRDVDAVAD